MSTQRAPQYRRRLGLVAVAAATAVTLTACGGSDDSDRGKDGKSGAQASEAPKDLKVGQAGPAQEITRYDKTGKFSITPTKVTVGKPADLKELDDEKKYKGKKVAWIYVKAKLVGGSPVKQPMVMSNVNAETSDGSPATKFILIGALSSQPEDCVGNDGKRELGREDVWKKGEERTVCEPYLIPADATVKSVTYSQGFYKEPLKWALR
ncbi:hypothetical protein [Streptomyces sp. MNP-20]|uniref:hypothetical protein n=1 Tax=Streptomyces sp. MNP-20 TaxID=2721165 RepID=UPI0015569EDF|nr:hypothetical protein [Streptomyces sp. MNP-20]